MLERIIIFLAIFSMATIVWLVAGKYRAIKAASADAGKLFSRGKPAILYFWSEGCVVCRTLQKPAIESILSENLVANLQFVAIDISEHPELTSEWGVMTVPSSFVINEEGICKYSNSGLVSKEFLTKQLQSL